MKTEAEMEKYEQYFLRTLQSFPEYNQETVDQYAKTGYGALANAGSFHNPLSRALRLMAFRKLEPIFQEYANKMGWIDINIQTVFDRMLDRKKNQSPSEECFHQDISIRAPGDVNAVFGGWLSFTDSTFICVPGTHTEVDPAGNGFATIDPTSPLYQRCKEYTAANGPVEIPKGHLLVFNQNLVHAVAKTKGVQRRQFIGFRLTYSNTDILGLGRRNRNSRQDGRGDPQDLFEVIEKQSVPKIPSNQLPPWFNVRSVDDPKQHQGLYEWQTRNLKRKLMTEDDEIRYFSGTKKVKYPFPIAPLFAPSLEELGAKYSPYRGIEKQILAPTAFGSLSASDLKAEENHLLTFYA
jgi:hypothetical protein